MRITLALAVATLWAGTAFAAEPAACYVGRDPTGDFVPEKIQSFAADPQIAAQVTHAMNETNRITGKCVEKYVRREGNWPTGGAAILFGVRIAPNGKVTQASVLDARNVNDAMLMACIGRSICGWELEPSADGQERLISLPPHLLGRGYARNRNVGID